MKKRILGIDPGSCITGFSILELQDKKTRCVVAGCLRLKGESASEKLGGLLSALSTLMQTYEPHEMAIEAIFMHKNASSALKLGQARGVALAAASLKQLPVFEYAARQVKLAITGKGGADKTQVQFMVSQLLNLKEALQADAADALAIALCHAHIQTGWSGIIREGGLAVFSRKRTVRKRNYTWPNYEK